MTNVAWLFEISDVDRRPAVVSARRWWSGKGTLNFGGVEWTGADSPNGSLIEIGNFTQTLDLPGQRVQVRIGLTSDSIRNILNVDLGGVRMTIRYIYLNDLPVGWTEIGRSIIVRMDDVRLDGNVATIRGETYIGSLGRPDPLYWSNATQQSRYPGDKAFAQASELSLDYQLRWPPSRN